MKDIDAELLKEIAHKLRFELSKEECLSLLSDFKVISKQIELLSRIPGIDDVEPQIYPYPISIDSLREDVVSETLSQEEVLRNAPETKDGMIKLPRK